MSLKALAGWLRPTPPQDADPPEHHLRSVSRTHVGRVRAINEDRLLDMPEHRLWAIADGMGGHAAGDIAAEAAIAALERVALDGRIGADAIEAALARVNRQLHERTRQGAPMSGATVVAMFEWDGAITILWAGDCRAYRLRDGGLVQLTRDHSVVQELLDAGALDAGQAARHPQAHVVTRALGAGEEVLLDRAAGECRQGDRYLLCSDGLALTAARLRERMRTSAPPSAIAGGLIEDALLGGGNDNVSLILVEIC